MTATASAKGVENAADDRQLQSHKLQLVRSVREKEADACDRRHDRLRSPAAREREHLGPHKHAPARDSQGPV